MRKRKGRQRRECKTEGGRGKRSTTMSDKERSKGNIERQIASVRSRKRVGNKGE